MEQNTPNTLKQPWNTPGRLAAWFLLLFISAFAVICGIALLTDQNVRSFDLVPFALIVSAVVAVGGFGLFFFFRWVRSGKNFRRFLFGAACLVTFVLLAYAEENWRGKRAWQKHQEYWEAKGEKFILAALVPPPVPDDKNFALTPFLKPLYDYSLKPGVIWRDTNALARIDAVSAQLPARRGSKQSLDMGSLQRGMLADLNAWAAFYRGNTNYPQAAAGAPPGEVVLKALGKFDSEFKELHEAAATRPYSRFPIDYAYQPSWAILLPHLSRIKGLTVLAHVRAVAELDLGRSTAALKDLQLAFRLSNSVRDEPILIDHLVRIACLTIALEGVREGIARHAWSDAQLAEIETHLRSIDLLAEYKQVMRGERAFGTSGLDYLRRHGTRDTQMSYPDADGGSTYVNSFRLLPSAMFYHNMINISHMYQDFILPAVDEQARRVSPDLTDKQTTTLEHMRTGPYTIFAKLLLPALGKAALRSARAQTSLDTVRVACAIERYRLVKSSLPASLDSLAPAFIDAIPKDVIDGQPLRYRLESPDHYLIYSIGWNRTDDGGVLAWSKEHKTVEDTRGDWVWTMGPRSPENAK